MIEIIQSDVLPLSKWEEMAMQQGVKVSVGYLKKAAKENTNIGVGLVEYFLRKYPDVDANWLIKGEGIKGNSEKNITLSDINPVKVENLQKRVETQEKVINTLLEQIGWQRSEIDEQKKKLSAHEAEIKRLTEENANLRKAATANDRKK